VSAEWETSEDMTFDMAVCRLSEFVFQPGITKRQLVAMSRACGLAYGMSPCDVLLLAASDAAIAIGKDRDALLAIYPEWARRPGADYA
jgi:hypothetical protein